MAQPGVEAAKVARQLMQIRDRIKELRRVPASQLRPSPRNWRTHPKSQQDALRGVLAEIGYADALLARELPDAALELIDGHLRAETTPDSIVPVLILDVTQEEADKILATLDPLAALAEADKGKLEDLLKSVHTDSPALLDMLKGLAVGNGIGPALPTPGGGGDDFDATPDEAGPCRVQKGDLWVIGGKHRLLCGDSTKAEDVGRLMAGEKAALIWSDPPYGVNHSGGTKDPRQEDYRSGDKLQNDNLSPEALREMLVAAYSLPAVVPGATAYAAAPAGPLLAVFMVSLAEAGYPYRGHVVWVKNAMVFGRSLYHYRHEPILYGWREDGPHYEDGDRTLTSVFEVDRQGVNSEHPTMKPLALVQPMVAHSSKSGDIVYDPFLGSGTTLIAAHRLNRRCYGLEIEPKYCEVILKRAEAEGLTAEKSPSLV